MRTVRVVAATFLFGALFPLGVAAPAACAAEGPHAVLVVDTEQSGGQYRYCVALPDNSVSGIELIELANQQHGLQYRLGYGGNVVCQLAGIGYDSDECLKSGPEFWGYWRGDGSGGWDWSSTGGHATTVTDGDVEGWAWGTGNDGSTHPAPPETTFESVCGAPAGGGGDGGGGNDDGSKAPPKSHEGDAKGGDASASIPSIAAQEEAGAKGGKGAERIEKERRRKRRAGGDEKDDKKTERPDAGEKSLITLTPSPSPSIQPTSSTDTGPPAGGFIATGAVAACIGGAIVLQRRRARAR